MAGERLDANRSALDETIESTALRLPRKRMNLGGEVVGNHGFRGAKPSFAQNEGLRRNLDSPSRRLY